MSDVNYSSEIDVCYGLGDILNFPVAYSHGRARVGTCPPCPGRGGSWDSCRSKSVFGGRGRGKWRTDPCNNPPYRKAFDNYKLSVYIWLLEAFAPRPPPGLSPWTSLGTSIPQTAYAHPDFRAWLHHWNFRLSIEWTVTPCRVMSSCSSTA